MLVSCSHKTKETAICSVWGWDCFVTLDICTYKFKSVFSSNVANKN